MDTRHGMAVPRGLDRPAGSSGGRFEKLFHLDPLVQTDAEIEALVACMTFDPPVQNRLIPAGFTYLGQFIDHDITFDPVSIRERENDPRGLENFRTPRFDLDSLYGTGPRDQPFLYDQATPKVPGVKLLVGRNQDRDRAPSDLPRNQQGRALIGDSRNDENVIVAQLHLLFIRFHNKAVDRIGAAQPGLTPDELFERARAFVRWHYQWIVVHDFLHKVVGKDLAEQVLRPGAGGGAETVDCRFYTSAHAPAIPFEFSAAAYRFGHSMVRPDYKPNLATPNVPLFPVPGEVTQHMGGMRRLPAELEIDWDLFFFSDVVADQPPMANRSMRIDPLISTRLARLPPDGKSLPRLNMQRGRALELPAGLDVAREMGRTDPAIVPLTEAQVDATVLDQRLPRDTADVLKSMLPRLPLWVYVLLESTIAGRKGRQLGPLGGRIVAEVLVGLLQADESSYLHAQPVWTPELGTAGADGRRDFEMRDLVAYAQDPGKP